MSTSVDRYVAWALVLIFPVLAVFLPNDFYLSLLVYGMINSIAATGLCLMLGFAGQISLAQAAFFGIGAYTTALSMNRLHIGPLPAIFAGAVISMICGWLISRPLSRLNDHYLAMATLVVGSIMYILFANAAWLTGGLDPGISIGKHVVLGLDLSSMRGLFAVVWAALILNVFIAVNVASSRIGRSLRAIKMAPAAAACVGIDVVRAKAFVFALSAFLAGLAGGLYGLYSRSFNAGSFQIGYAIDLLMMVVIGSLSRVSGAIVGAFIITLLPVFFEHFEDYKTMIFGIAMVVIMKLMPMGMIEGLFSMASRIFCMRKG